MSNKSRRKTPKKRSSTKPVVSNYAPLLIGGSVVGLGLGILLFGALWPVSSDEETAYINGGAAGLVSGLLGAAAIAGSLVMTVGTKLAWFAPLAGVFFAIGFTGLVLASSGADTAPWFVIGAAGLIASVAWFYMIGMISGALPLLFFNRYGTWGAPFVGVVLIVVGAVNDIAEVLVLGMLTIAAWAGILIGSLVLRRRRAPASATPARGPRKRPTGDATTGAPTP